MGISGRDEIDFQRVTLDELLDMFYVTDHTGNNQYASEIVNELMRRASLDQSPTAVTHAPNWLKKSILSVFWHQRDGGGGG